MSLSLTLSVRDYISFGSFALVTLAFLFLRNELDATFLILAMLLGLVIAIVSSEKAVHGVDILGKKLKLSPYVAGVLSSLASNLPELVIGIFAVLAGKTEFAIAFIVVATGFNILMLGILILIGNYVRKGPIIVPKEVIDVEVPILRVAILMMGSIFVLGITLFAVEGINPDAGVPHLPYTASLITVLVYFFYLYFIIKHNLDEQKSKLKAQKEEGISPDDDSDSDAAKTSRSMLFFILFLAFTFIFFAGEMISSSVELFLALDDSPITISEFQLAFLIGLAASVPEHAIALIAVKKEGGIELGMGNLMAGSMQNLLLMIGLVSLFSFLAAVIGIHPESNLIEGIPLVHTTEDGRVIPFLLVQFGFSWLMLSMIKTSMTDDAKLDWMEGILITVAQIFVFIIFLQEIL